MPLNIVVCVKQVPDSWAEKKLNEVDKTLDRASADPVMNELDEYGIEEALRLQEAHGGQVTILCMGPEKAGETIRKALSMGADDAIHVVDDALHGSDAVATSAALAAALGTVEFDLVILGSESTDARMSVIPAMLAERLQSALASLGPAYLAPAPERLWMRVMPHEDFVSPFAASVAASPVFAGRAFLCGSAGSGSFRIGGSGGRAGAHVCLRWGLLGLACSCVLSQADWGGV